MKNSKSIILPRNCESIWLIGFRFDPDIAKPDFLTLIFSGDEDLPLTLNNYILFFRDIKLIEIEADPSSEIQNLQLPQEINLVVDIAEISYILFNEDIDESIAILDSLNIIFDLVKATGISFKPIDKKNLYALADHLTFSKDLSSFFCNIDITRENIHDAILWCIGAICSKSKLLENKIILNTIGSVTNLPAS
ncbi:hypothetical protein [Acaryochloris marina]|uniref:hypothetical protein n=1 Tax=Acaryochloris marina TaxID=155978 RepID=UPI001BAF2C4D|nr:hypothetical protein [Acaryochloris marina]QUY46219.1 hypothetical protein I1H34_31360 [Acaryochloris marina S15]